MEFFFEYLKDTAVVVLMTALMIVAAVVIIGVLVAIDVALFGGVMP